MTITDMLEKGAKALWGTDDFSKISEAGLSYEYEQFRRHYMPFFRERTAAEALPL